MYWGGPINSQGVALLGGVALSEEVTHTFNPDLEATGHTWATPSVESVSPVVAGFEVS